ncbi:polyadenylate-specific 3'-exoribonuclease AS [Corynebacterium oculi]|uniref:3'-5' exoribonuclease n=1 Tax=Corynebacterium oculi TaxID=1544416 RepID=A0A0Q1AEV4_9CORY|nr:polyadenylate-specific 3'-exoribonuclease AS [Corynebacterium oculi]KQB85204.1 3'-5' exoribonuclease [Corynebacterium oculi]
MRYFYDTEFVEDGRTIELVSIGIVSEDGREYYAVSTDFDERRANPWVRENVLSKLPSPHAREWKPQQEIRQEVYEFLTSGAGRPELWAWVGAYDHVVLAQLWGDMAGLPREIPRYTRELKQLWEMAGRPELPAPPTNAHDALADARYNVVKFRVCQERLFLGEDNRVRGVS